MERGYNVAYDDSGRLLSSVEQVKPHDHIEINFSDGKVEAEIITIKER